MDVSVAEARWSEVGQLINKGKWQKALRKASANVKDPYMGKRAKTHFQMALVSRLLFLRTEAAQAHEKARRSEGYTPHLEGDFRRDEAIMWIKLGGNEKAKECLQLVWELHADDSDRLACWKMVKGRLFTRLDMLEDACRMHAAADVDWERLGARATGQWRINNRLHWMTALVLAGRPKEARAILPLQLSTDRWQRKLAGLAVCYGGRRGANFILSRY